MTGLGNRIKSLPTEREGSAAAVIRAVRAEHLKMKRTFGRVLPAVSALLALLSVLSFSRGKYFAVSAWNWWYAMLLPGMLSILCYLGMKREKKLHYAGLLTLPWRPSVCLSGKILYYAGHLFLANLLLMAGTFVAAAFWGSDIAPSNSLAAVILLSVCYLWEIPLFMIMGARFGIFVSLFSCMTLTIGGTAVLAASKLWWVCPSAVPIRLMGPVLGILPNGLMAPQDSPVLDPGVLLPGIWICLIWFAGLAGLAMRCFKEA